MCEMCTEMRDSFAPGNCNYLEKPRPKFCMCLECSVCGECGGAHHAGVVSCEEFATMQFCGTDPQYYNQHVVDYKWATHTEYADL